MTSDDHKEPDPERMLFTALDGVLRQDFTPWVEMFHDDGVIEYPFAPPQAPDRLSGKASIAEAMARFPFELERVEKRHVHRCGEVLIAEFNCYGTAKATGKRYDQTYIAVMTLHNGKVANYRDYWNPLVALAAMS